jgi:bifunctional polynucleotide phosphatase/kinase
MSPPQSALKRGATEDRTLSPPPIKRKQQSTTTSKAVANFFKPTSQKEPERVTWQIVDQTLLVGKHHVSEENKVPVVDGKQKIAAFDFVCEPLRTRISH